MRLLVRLRVLSRPVCVPDCAWPRTHVHACTRTSLCVCAFALVCTSTRVYARAPVRTNEVMRVCVRAAARTHEVMRLCGFVRMLACARALALVWLQRLCVSSILYSHGCTRAGSCMHAVAQTCVCAGARSSARVIITALDRASARLCVCPLLRAQPCACSVMHARGRRCAQSLTHVIERMHCFARALS